MKDLSNISRLMEELEKEIEKEVKKEQIEQTRKTSKEAALTTRIMVDEFVRQGFSEEQSIDLLKYMLKIGMENKND